MNEFKITSKIIKFLAIRAGKEVSRHELVKNFIEHSDKKNSHKHHKKHKSEENGYLLDLLLNLLEGEKLIRSLGKKLLFVEKPFLLHGQISLSKRGDGFVKLNSGTEIFVPASATESSIDGDYVDVIPMGIGRKGKLEGEVMNIARRKRILYRFKVLDTEGNFIAGKLLDMSGGLKEGIIPKKTILGDILKSIKVDDILVVKLKENAFHDSNLYEVSFIRFESDSEIDPDFNRILMKYNYELYYPDLLPHTISEEVAPATVVDWERRADLQELYTVTIDGETSKDFDDAISLVEEENRVRFYVHIADVSYYVKQASALDEEAYRRSTSVYLSNGVVPMLPPLLSENLCSLVEGKPRLAFTVEMEGDWSGQIYYAKFYKSIIKVDKRCTYESVEKELNINDPDNWFSKLMRLANEMRKRRVESGRVDLNLKESHIIMDNNFSVIQIIDRERLNSHILIEEFMLSANIKVAEFLRKRNAPALYRVHEPMEKDKLKALNSFLALYGLNHWIKDIDYQRIREVLELMEGHPSEKVFNYFLLRSFKQAYYTGKAEGHWGLGFQDYCHFTSPIRRYPDLVCHRVLDSLLKSDPLPYSIEEIETMGLYCSDRERAAVDAERDMMKLKACRYVESTGIRKFNGNIIGVKSHFVFVELDELNVEGVVRFYHFTDEDALIIPNEFSFVSKKYSRAFYLGQKLELEIEEIDLEEIRIFLKPKGSVL
ncbi:MAG: VacB/RNase II family 3'-5' exoribonuclease [Leptospiraceae bacterium]|nr:VacB/RNase II family 3'-5' exoribonuclease [Leptospiraceae bacterium]